MVAQPGMTVPPASGPGPASGLGTGPPSWKPPSCAGGGRGPVPASKGPPPGGAKSPVVVLEPPAGLPIAPPHAANERVQAQRISAARVEAATTLVPYHILSHAAHGRTSSVFSTNATVL